MPSLYSCRHSGDQYRITKMDANLDIESSYLCDLSACDCPAGVRPTCRHRQMLPKFIQREHVGDEWMYDFDRGGWVQMELDEPEREPSASEALPIQPVPIGEDLAPQPSLELSSQPDQGPVPTPTIRRRV